LRAAAGEQLARCFAQQQNVRQPRVPLAALASPWAKLCQQLRWLIDASDEWNAGMPLCLLESKAPKTALKKSTSPVNVLHREAQPRSMKRTGVHLERHNLSAHRALKPQTMAR
jgi:hypothetical protein